jgi:hypothetical protein
MKVPPPIRRCSRSDRRRCDKTCSNVTDAGPFLGGHGTSQTVIARPPPRGGQVLAVSRNAGNDVAPNSKQGDAQQLTGSKETQVSAETLPQYYGASWQFQQNNMSRPYFPIVAAM